MNGTGNPRPDGELPPAEDIRDDTVIKRALWWSIGTAAAVLLLAAAWKMFLLPSDDGAERFSSLAIPVIGLAGPKSPGVVPPNLPFSDVTHEAGIVFVHENGAEGEMLLPEAMGGGCAVFDYDGDGASDLLLVNSARRTPGAGEGTRPTTALYRNDGRGRFADVSREAGVDFPLDGMGVAVGDFDNDGWPDLFISALGSNRLLHNDGGRFRDVTTAAGVAGAEDAWSTSCCWFDFDRDGDLDLFVCNYLDWSAEADRAIDSTLTGTGRAYSNPDSFQGSHPYLYRNEGNGRFTDVSAAAGVQVWNEDSQVPVSKALGVAVVDIDRDGWPDLVVSCDGVRNLVFRNRRDGTFEETGGKTGLGFDRYGTAQRAFGIDAADLGGDGELAIAMGRRGNELNALYREQPPGFAFTDDGISTGFGSHTRLVLSFSVCFLDADLDGRLDLLTANGQIQPDFSQLQASQTWEQPPLLFWNASDDTSPVFIPLAAEHCGEDLVSPMAGRGAAYADLDADGDLDVLLTAAGGPPRLLRNEQQLGHHWLRLKLLGQVANRDATGAVVELTAAGRTQYRQVMPPCGYLSQREIPITFGLGEHAIAERVTVTWPDGSRQLLENVPADQIRTVVQPLE